ncbi:MAG: hypothetical protein ACREMA_03770, partial [Longimicrobiales bacterium]
MKSRNQVLAVASLMLAVACSSDKPTGVDDPGPGPGPGPGPVSGAAARGRVAFQASCAECHATADGIDLAFFNFADT